MPNILLYAMHWRGGGQAHRMGGGKACFPKNIGWFWSPISGPPNGTINRAAY